MPTVPFGQWYVSESLPIAAQEVVNFYLAKPQSPGITDLALFGKPGLVEITTAGGLT